MKKILTILIAVLSLQGYSQGWAEVGSIWHYTKGTINPDLTSYTTFESISDTVISGIPCRYVVQVDRVYDTSAVYSHFMYSSNDSVFFYRDGEFHLLLYFGAVAGDTIVLGFGTASGDPLLMIVDSTSVINVNGETRTIQYVNCGDGLIIEYADEVIEGIGSTAFMFPTADGELYGSLRCYEDNVVGLFLSPFHPYFGWNFEECDEILTGIDEIDGDKSLSAYPNPFATATTIVYELTKPSRVQLTVYNVIGGVVYQAEDRLMAVGKYSFIWSAESLPEGLYYVVLRSEQGVSVMKIVKQY